MNEQAGLARAAPFHPASGGQRRTQLLLAGVLAGAMLLSACGTRSLGRAPVEDRGVGAARPVPSAVDTGSVKLLAGAENAGKPGFYTVKPGDTLIRIGLDTGQNWRDIGRWSNLENPNLIEVGQVLRVAPPVENSAVVVRPVTSGSASAVAPAPASSASESACRSVTTGRPQASAACQSDPSVFSQRRKLFVLGFRGGRMCSKIILVTDSITSPGNFNRSRIVLALVAPMSSWRE